ANVHVGFWNHDMTRRAPASAMAWVSTPFRSLTEIAFSVSDMATNPRPSMVRPTMTTRLIMRAEPFSRRILLDRVFLVVIRQLPHWHDVGFVPPDDGTILQNFVTPGSSGIV